VFGGGWVGAGGWGLGGWGAGGGGGLGWLGPAAGFFPEDEATRLLSLRASCWKQTSCLLPKRGHGSGFWGDASSVKVAPESVDVGRGQGRIHTHASLQNTSFNGT
jgi:hypothetical protein